MVKLMINSIFIDPINFQIKFSSYPRCTLHDDFGKYLMERQFCDVQFVIGLEEVTIPAHIAMVAARSPFLRAKILWVWRESQSHS